MAQVFTDLGSISVEAGTCDRYPPYLSLNLVLKFLIESEIYKQNVENLIRKGLLSELNYYSTLTRAQYYHHIIYCSCYNWNLFKIVNIYHRYPNKIFIIPIMTISILHIGCSVMAKLPI